jgi:hypothetical protein
MHNTIEKVKNYYSFYYIILLLIISTMVIGSFVMVKIDGDKNDTFKAMINGTCYKPFVSRCLVPVIIRNTSSLIPETIKKEVNDWGIKNIIYLTMDRNNIELTDLLLAIIIWYASIIGFALIFMRLILLFYSVEDKFLYLFSLIAVAGLPIFFKYYSYLYDFPQLFLFTLGLFLLAKQKWSFYLFALAMSTVNKETSILLIFIYFIYYKNRLSKSVFTKLFVYQIFIYLAIKIVLTATFINNPGHYIEFHLFRNLGMEPYSISQFVSFIIIGIAIVYDWKNKPSFLRHSTSILIPLILLTFVFGFFDEYRDYYEAYPVIFLLITHSVCKVLDANILRLRTINS